MLEADFRGFCLAREDLAAGLGGELHHMRLPPSPRYPAAVFRVISDVPENDHDTRGDTLSAVRVQVDVYDTSGERAARTRDLFKAALNGASGAQGETDFQEMAWAGSVALFDELLDVHRYSIDLELMASPYEAARVPPVSPGPGPAPDEENPFLSVDNFEDYANSKGYTEEQVEAKLFALGFTAADASDFEAALVAGTISKEDFDSA